MLRMEIALFLVVAFVAYMYFTAEKATTRNSAISIRSMRVPPFSVGKL